MRNRESGRTNHNIITEAQYQASLQQLSNITQEILLKLKPLPTKMKSSQKKNQVIYPNDTHYAEIQKLLGNIAGYYQNNKRPLNQEIFFNLTQTTTLLKKYSNYPSDSSLNIEIANLNKKNNDTFYERIVQLTLSMLLTSCYLYQFTFVSQAALIAAKIFIINTSFLGIIAIAAYIYLTYVKKEHGVNKLLPQLLEKLSPYGEVLRKTATSADDSSLSSQSVNYRQERHRPANKCPDTSDQNKSGCFKKPKYIQQSNNGNPHSNLIAEAMKILEDSTYSSQASGLESPEDEQSIIRGSMTFFNTYGLASSSRQSKNSSHLVMHSIYSQNHIIQGSSFNNSTIGTDDSDSSVGSSQTILKSYDWVENKDKLELEIQHDSTKCYSSQL